MKLHKPVRRAYPYTATLNHNPRVPIYIGCLFIYTWGGCQPSNGISCVAISHTTTAKLNTSTPGPYIKPSVAVMTSGAIHIHVPHCPVMRSNTLVAPNLG